MNEMLTEAQLRTKAKQDVKRIAKEHNLGKEETDQFRTLVFGWLGIKERQK